jgi:hypothetical protein
MKGQKLPAPRAVSVNEICSECGELWALHPADATLLDCVRLLKLRPSTTIVTSPCNCWCHHTLTVTPPALPYVPYYWTSDVSNDLSLTSGSSD